MCSIAIWMPSLKCPFRPLPVFLLRSSSFFFNLELCEHFASLETNSLFLSSVANVYYPILRVVFFFPFGLPFLCKTFLG